MCIKDLANKANYGDCYYCLHRINERCKIKNTNCVDEKGCTSYRLDELPF